MDNEQTPITPPTPPAAPLEPQAQPIAPAAPIVAPESTPAAPVMPENAPVAAPSSVIAPAAPVVTPAPASTNVPAPVVMTSDTPASVPEAPKKSGHRKLLISFLIALLAVVLIGGGSAAAYFGVVVPNKPENVLMKSVLTTLQQKQSTYNGTFEIHPASGSGTAVKATFNGSADLASKAADMTVNLTVSGVDLTVNARYVNKDLYFKVGDLKTISSLLSGIDPSYGPLVAQLNNTVSNKWIKVDSTLIGSSAEASCVLNANFALNNKDIDTIKAQYKAHPFVTIVSSSADTLNGKNVQKYVLSINDDKATVFTNHLGPLSPIQTLQKCTKDKSLSTKQTGDHDKTPLTVWVDKDTKQIVQLSTKTTQQDAKQDNITGSTTITMDYSKPVHVTAPASSTSVMDLLGQLETQLGGASALNGSPSFDTSPFDSL